jgi:cell division transport system permease protein
MSECPSGSAWRQALGAIGRRPVAWLASVLMAGVALAAVLLAAISFWSLRPLAEQSGVAPEAAVLLSANAAAPEAEALRTALALLPTVAATRFVSRDAALAQIASRTPADRDAIGQLASNPLPDVVEVTFRPDATPDAIEAAVVTIRKMARVDGVELDLGWYRKFRALARLGVFVSAAIWMGFVVHAAGWLLVAVALSAPIDARRVQLLWLLGADDRGVRRTPVAAAALTALAAAAVALVVARAGWVWLDHELGSITQLYASPARLHWPPPAWVAGFVGAAMVAGALIGSVRARARLGGIRRELAGPSLA